MFDTDFTVYVVLEIFILLWRIYEKNTIVIFVNFLILCIQLIRFININEKFMNFCKQLIIFYNVQ